MGPRRNNPLLSCELPGTAADRPHYPSPGRQDALTLHVRYFNSVGSLLHGNPSKLHFLWRVFPNALDFQSSRTMLFYWDVKLAHTQLRSSLSAHLRTMLLPHSSPLPSRPLQLHFVALFCFYQKGAPPQGWPQVVLLPVTKASSVPVYLRACPGVLLPRMPPLTPPKTGSLPGCPTWPPSLRTVLFPACFSPPLHWPQSTWTAYASLLFLNILILLVWSLKKCYRYQINTC